MEPATELSLALPHSLNTRVYVRLSVQSKAVLLFLTTASTEELGSPPPLGSFVYALPDASNPGQALSTPLVTVEATVEFTSRLAKLVARKTRRPTYVANSISFANAGLGGTVEEETDAYKAVAELVLAKLPRAEV